MKYSWLSKLIKKLFMSKAFKRALLLAMGSNFAKLVGFKAWLVGLLIDYGLNKAIIPLANELLLWGYAKVDTVNGKATIILIKEAVSEEDRDKWLANMSKL